MVQYIKTVEEFNSITGGSKPVLIDFTAAWCGPCKVIGPIFDKCSTEEQNAGVEFYKVDVDDAADVAQQCGITAMPTFKLYKNGEEVDSLRGANPGGLEALVAKAKEA